MWRTTARAAVTALCVLLMTTVQALEFDMIYQTKCIMEEINENVLVLGEFSATKKADSLPVLLNVKASSHNLAAVVISSIRGARSRAQACR